MTIIAGVDGCPGGWICILADTANGRVRSALHRSSKDLLQCNAAPEIIAIDIPIGLTDKEPRQCDQEARRLLGFPRSSSVFPAPIRSAVGAESRALASKITFAVNGRKVGLQSWGIFPKIREIDVELRTDVRLPDRVREVHPELCFWALNNCESMACGKKSRGGKSERRRLIDKCFGAKVVDRVRDEHREKHVGSDDIYDAFAALWTARRIVEGVAVVIPNPAPVDSAGLPMGIWY